jgi:predicted helicase
MTIDHRKALLGIKRFDQLIVYLRDELGWPISRDSFDDVDDLFYDFSPEELGIDPKTAAKIQEIKRLRPLSAKQPWGIFFVKFEPKKLPVVVLRKILSQVALKRRESANSPERAAWSADDLLFISNYGEGDERQINFAHFSKSPTLSDLPTLRVMGWNSLDTPLHLDAVAAELTQNLRWPDDDDNLEQWRKSWSNAFKLGHNEVINTAKDLSERLAQLASRIRDQIKSTLSIESENGSLTKLMKAFQSSLLHDLDVDGFADMYAQTIAYGLLSARITDPAKKTVDDLTSHMKTSPFLKELLEAFLHIGGRKGKAGEAGIDFDELGVGDVVSLLDSANMEAVVRDFGDKNRQEDPVMHFFEGFLQAYDRKIRKDRGVFYTPQPVVSYIVSSVHNLLQSEFGLEDGLASTATWGEMLKKYPNLKLPLKTREMNEVETISLDDPFVQILDPATGTATFLIEVIDVIYRTLVLKWQKAGFSSEQQNIAWNDYVPKHLLPRLHAFELMMAPYAIAHMKIGLKLSETGYKFLTDERARIYLTNALEPWLSQPPLIGLDALAHEAIAVNEVKKTARFTVIIGNPPYSGVSLNNFSYAVRLVDAYKLVDGKPLDEKKLWLQDDYVKFIRFSQLHLSDAGIGILGFITNHGYLDNPTFRGMRQSLLDTFSHLSILDLHGNSNKGEQSPDGDHEENVFDIKQGVSIFLGVNPVVTSDESRSLYYSLWGRRDAKYKWLSNHSNANTDWTDLVPVSPYRFLVPRNDALDEEYKDFFPLEKVVKDRTVGMITARDSLTIQYTQEEIEKVVKDFSVLNSDEARLKFNLGKDSRDWSVERAQDDVLKNSHSKDCYRTVLYRPFDVRHTFYTGTSRGFIGQPQKRIMAHLDGKYNWALCVSRFNRQKSLGYFFVTKTLTDFHLLDTVADSMTVFPLYLSVDRGAQKEFSFRTSESPNFNDEFIEILSRRLGVKNYLNSAAQTGLMPEHIFWYIYAIFHSEAYRNRYSDFLKIEFPRVPLPKNLSFFKSMAVYGEALIRLHLLELTSSTEINTNFIGDIDCEIEKITWSNNTVWINKAATTGFEGVCNEVWNFHIGGYQVCQKWLKDRKDRRLTSHDVEQYKKMVGAISGTMKIMKKIDLEIQANGGFPSAFKKA